MKKVTTVALLALSMAIVGCEKINRYAERSKEIDSISTDLRMCQAAEKYWEAAWNNQLKYDDSAYGELYREYLYLKDTVNMLRKQTKIGRANVVSIGQHGGTTSAIIINGDNQIGNHNTQNNYSK